MYCNKCGAKLPEDSNFCYVCGNKVSDIEVLFKETKAQDEDKNKNGPAIEKKKEKNEKNFIKEPKKASGEFSSMLDKKLEEETTLLMDRKDLSFPDPGDQEVSKKPSKEPRSKKNKNKADKSTFKRFVEYMKEEETYDKSFFDKKPNLPDVEEENKALEKQEPNLYKADDPKDKKPEVKKEEKVEAKAKAKKEKPEKKPPVQKPKKDSKSGEEKPKGPNIFQKISAFLKEEDEDRLLDLSPEDYQRLMKGQGEVSYEDLLRALDGEEEVQALPKENSSFMSSVKTVLGPKKDSDKEMEEVDFDKPLETEPEDTIKKTVSKPYTFEDSGQTIRYSKTVIDSLLDKHEKGELKTEDFDKIDDFIKKDTADLIRPKEKPTKVEKSPKDEEGPKNLEEEKVEETYKELEVPLKPQEKKAKKPKAPKEKKEAKPKKNYFKLIFDPIIDFFKSLGKFFSMSQKKDKKASVDNIDIIMSSPVESSDTMPLVLSEEERNILNKEIDKRQGKNRAAKVLKKSNAKVHGHIRKLLSYGIKVTLPLLIITFILCLLPISWLVNNPGFIGFFAILKYVIIYLTIQAATNSAFKSIGLRLKRSVINFFVLSQALVYLIIDSIYIYLTMVDDQTLEALLKVLSPKMRTMVVFLLLALLLLLANYKKVKEKDGVALFVGWYLVVSLTITVMVILLELLLGTVFWPVLAKFLF